MNDSRKGSEFLNRKRTNKLGFFTEESTIYKNTDFSNIKPKHLTSSRNSFDNKFNGLKEKIVINTEKTIDETNEDKCSYYRFSYNNGIKTKIKNEETINEKTSQFIESFINEIENKKTKVNLGKTISVLYDFDKFKKQYNWDIYEYILIKTIQSLNSNYSKFNRTIDYYYFNENMSKIFDEKFTKEIIIPKLNPNSKTKFMEEVEKFTNEKKELFEKLSLDIKSVSNKYSCFYIAFIYNQLREETELDFTDYNFNNLNNQLLISSIKFSDNIIQLSLATNELAPEACFWLGSMLRINRNLLDLNISSCNINDNSLDILFKGLTMDFKDKELSKDLKGGYLNKLNLSNNKLTNKGGIYLGKLLKYFRKLEFFNISSNQILNEGASNLFETYQTILEEEITNEDNFLMRENKLETLILSDIGIYSESCLKILGSLLGHPKCNLKSIILSKNNIGENNPKNDYTKLREIKYLLQCLGNNTSVTEFFLLDCNIGNDLIDDIYNMLLKNNYLEFLTLYKNKITETNSINKLISAVSCSNQCGFYNLTLKSLDLSKNGCIIEGGNSFSNIINGLQLSCLDLSQNKITNDALDILKESVKILPNKVKIIY